MKNKDYAEYIYCGLGIAIGLFSGFIIYTIFNSIFCYDWSHWKTMLGDGDIIYWAMLAAMYCVPVISGLLQWYNGESLWRILLFPFLAGAAATVTVFLVGMVVFLFTSGEILKIILGIGIFLTLVAPATRVVVIFFEQ